MRGAFEDDELETLNPRRDTELTLGSGALLTIFLGLSFLCILCFGLGYIVGHRSAAAVTALPTPSQPIEASNNLAKPPATAQTDSAQSPDTDDSAQPQNGANSGAQAVPVSGSATGAAGQPSVHPALTSVPAPNQPVQSVPTPALQPAVAQGVAAPAAGSLPAGSLPAGSLPAGSLMVQIAAVSNLEDAQVLADALRKHGYAVTAQRDPADNLIHVRVGPFGTLAEANNWKMKLLNDGYNAVVQQ